MTQAQVKTGIVEIIKRGIVWPPNLAKYISLCKNINTDDAFDRLIQGKKALDEVERRTNGEVGFKCRTQLAEKEARSVYKNCYMKWHDRFERGEVKDRVALPDKSCVDIMQNGEAVELAGKIPAGKGHDAFKAMRERLKNGD